MGGVAREQMPAKPPAKRQLTVVLGFETEGRALDRRVRGLELILVQLIDAVFFFFVPYLSLATSGPGT